MKYTRVYYENKKLLDRDSFVALNQGGARSSKTYSILQLLLEIISKNHVRCAVIRSSRRDVATSTKSYADELAKQFIDLKITKRKIQDTMTGGEILFGSFKDVKDFDFIFLEEASEASEDDYITIKNHTNKLFLAFNPFDVTKKNKWLYAATLDSRNVLIKSNYRDNPFLPEGYVRALEGVNLKYDYNRWYVLGEF